MHENSKRNVTEDSREWKILGLGLKERAGCEWMGEQQVQGRGPVRLAGWFRGVS